MLLDDTLKRLKNDPRSVEQIARDSGLTYSWLSKFRAGLIPDPGIRRVQQLYKHLESEYDKRLSTNAGNGHEAQNFKRPRPKPKRAP